MATEEEKQAARDRLTRLTGRYEKAEAQLEQVRKEVSDEIAGILMARTLGPSEVTKLSPFERQHVGRIAKAAGVPPLREATVVSRAKAAAAPGPRPAAAPRQQVTQATWKPVPSISPRVAALPYERVKELADRARDRYPEWVDEIRQDHPHLRGPDLDLVIVELGREKGFKVEELSTTDKPQPAVAAPRVQASVAAPAVPAAEPEASPPLPEITEKQFRKAITLAQGRATPDQRQRLTRTAKVAEQLDRNKDDEVLKAALEMGLLTRDEVYTEPSERPVSGEETGG